MLLTVQEFADLCLWPTRLQIDVYDYKYDELVYSGYANEIPEDIGALFVESFDLPTRRELLTLNVRSE